MDEKCSVFSFQRENEREREKVKNNVVKDRNNYQRTYRSVGSNGSDFFLFFSFSFARCVKS
jgi:hypothetical protein